MSIERLLTQDVTLSKLDNSVKDEYGNSVPTAHGSAISIKAYLELVQSVESLNDRDTVVTDWKLYAPAGIDLDAFDRVNFNGQVFEVDGAPWSVYNPRTGVVSHVEAKLKVVQ